MSGVAHGCTDHDDLVLAVAIAVATAVLPDPDLERERSQEDVLLSEVPHPEEIAREAVLIDGDTILLRDAAAEFARRHQRVEEANRGRLPF